MAKVIDIRDSESAALFAVLVSLNNEYVAYGNNDRSKQFANWFNNQNIDISEIEKSLPSHLVSSKPRNITSSNAEYQSFLPSSLIDETNKKVLIIEAKSAPEDEYVGWMEGDLEEDSDAIEMWPVTDALIASIDVAYKQHLIDYKIKAFVLDKDISSLLLHVKGVRAIWDPDVKPGGGWRCPPSAGDTAGQFTNRFGRGCTLGATRRIGRGLIAAAGDDIQGLQKLGRTLDSAGARRQQGRLDKYGRRYARRTANADKTRTQIIASRIAEGLETSAGKLRDISERKPGQSRRQARRIREAVTDIEATEKARRSRRGQRRLRDASLRETAKPDASRLRRGKRTKPRKVTGATPQTPPSVERAEKRRKPRTRRGVAKEMLRQIDEKTPDQQKKPKPKKERKIKGRKPRSTERLRDRAARRLGQTAADVLDQPYTEPPAPKTPSAPDQDAPEVVKPTKRRRIRFIKPKKDSERSRRRRVTLSKTNRSGLFYPTKKQTAKQKGELLPDWDTLSDDQKSSVKSEALLALDALDKGWRKRLNKKKKDDLSEDEILDFLAELEKVDGQRAGILKTYLHNFLVLSDIEETDDFSKFNDIKPSLRKRILDAAGINGPSTDDDGSGGTSKPKPPVAPPSPPKPKTPPAPPTPPTRPADKWDNAPVLTTDDVFDPGYLAGQGLAIDKTINPGDAEYDSLNADWKSRDSDNSPDRQFITSRRGGALFDPDEFRRTTGISLPNMQVLSISEIKTKSKDGSMKTDTFVYRVSFDQNGETKYAHIYEAYPDPDEPSIAKGYYKIVPVRIVSYGPPETGGVEYVYGEKSPGFFVKPKILGSESADVASSDSNKDYAVADFISSEALSKSGYTIYDILQYSPDEDTFKNTLKEFEDQVELDPDFQVASRSAFAQFYDVDQLESTIGIKLNNGEVLGVLYTDKGLNAYVVSYDDADGNKKVARIYDVYDIGDGKGIPERLGFRIVPDVPVDEDGTSVREIGKDTDLPHFYVALEKEASSQPSQASDATPPAPSTVTTPRQPLDLNDRATPLLFVDTEDYANTGLEVDSVIMENFDQDEWNDLENKFQDVKDSAGRWTDITDAALADTRQLYFAPTQDGDDPVQLLNMRSKVDPATNSQIILWEYEYGPKDNRTIGKSMLVRSNGELIGQRIVANTSEDDPTVNWVTFKPKTAASQSSTPTPQANNASKTPKAPPKPPTPPAAPTPKAESRDGKVDRGGKTFWRGADVTGLIQKGDPKGTVYWLDPETNEVVDISDDLEIDSVSVALPNRAEDLPQIVSTRGANQIKYPKVTIDGKQTSIVPNVGTDKTPAMKSWTDSIEFLLRREREKRNSSITSWDRPRWFDGLKGVETIQDSLSKAFPNDKPLDKDQAITFVSGNKHGTGILGNVRLATLIETEYNYNDTNPIRTAIRSIAALPQSIILQSWDDDNPPASITDFIKKVANDNGIKIQDEWVNFVRTKTSSESPFEWRVVNGQYPERGGWRQDNNDQDLITSINNAITTGNGDDWIQAFEKLRNAHTEALAKRNALIKQFQQPGGKLGAKEQRELVIVGEKVESFERITDTIFDSDFIMKQVEKSEKSRYKKLVSWVNEQQKKAAARKEGKSKVGGALDPTDLLVPDTPRTPSEIAQIVSNHKSGKLFSEVSPLNPTPAITDEEKSLLTKMQDAWDSKKLPGSDKEIASGKHALHAALFTLNGYSDLPVQVSEEEAISMLGETDENGNPLWYVATRFVTPRSDLSGDEMVAQFQSGERFAGQGGTMLGAGDYFATGAGSPGYGPDGMVILLPKETRFADHGQMQTVAARIRSALTELETSVGRGTAYAGQQTLDINDFDAVSAKIQSLNSKVTGYSDDVQNRLQLYVDAFVDYWLQLEMSRIPNPRTQDEIDSNAEITRAQNVLAKISETTVAVFGGYDVMFNYPNADRQTDEDFANSITSINLGSGDGSYMVILNRTGVATIPGKRTSSDVRNLLARVVDKNGKAVWNG